jgi:hypothetical protein
LKILTFRTPTPETERCLKPASTTLDRYRCLLTDVGKGKLTLPNDNFDVGAKTGPSAYRLNDDAYAELLHRLAEHNFSGLTPQLQAVIEHFYEDPAAPNTTKRSRRRWWRVQRELAQLKSTTPVPPEMATRPNTAVGLQESR